MKPSLASRRRNRLAGGIAARKARSFKNGSAPVAPQDYNGKSIDREEPRLWIVGRVPTARQRSAKFGHAGEIVDRTERIDVRKHGSDPPRLGGKVAIAQQRIDPDHAPARFGE